mgnify:CR=1 FL=1
MKTINTKEIKPGMYLRVYQKVKEGNKSRTQRIEGLVLARKHGTEPGATATIRRIIKGVGIEWTIPIFSPTIEKVELIKETKARRAKLYYVREKSQKETRKRLKTLRRSKKAEIEEGSLEEKEIESKNTEKIEA